jgi:Tfp pilus assembly protein PilF
MRIHQSSSTVLKPAALLFIFIGLIYANTLHHPWQLDDYPNIIDNSQVHMYELSMASIKSGFYGSPFQNSPDRPLSYLSFALSWLYGKNDVTGYHVVNIMIHMITALMLYLTILNLLQTPNAGKWDQDSLYFIALFSAVFWSIHPIQIQAVTYIVQRMAAMAALFYLIGIFFYLKARMTIARIYQTIFWGLCILSFFLGIASKNNAILLPVSLLLIEIIFFRDLSLKSIQKKAAVILFASVFIIAGAGVILFMENGLNQVFDAYNRRPFTMGQRLMTQPVILLFYLSQIFYPIAHRLSITHDVTYATSLFQPWYIFFAIGMVILLIGFALRQIRKTPMLSFAILFYFGNHVIESTILPLEMVFEHRNYLPSFFLFVPIAMGIKKMLDHYSAIKRPMYYLLVGFICALMVGIGFSTYIRNWDWRSFKSLWEDAAQKAPQSARPLHNLAWGYYAPTGQYDKAIELYKTALSLKDSQLSFKATLYINMAGIYHQRLKDYQTAVDFAGKAIEISPDLISAQLVMCNSMVMLGQYDETLARLDKLLETQPTNPDMNYLKAFILMKTSRSEPALTYFRKCLQMTPNSWRYLRETGACLTQMGYYDRGYWYLSLARKVDSKNVGVLLALADNRLKKGSLDEAATHIQPLIQITGVEHIEAILEEVSKDPLGLPININGLAGLIASHIQALSGSYKNMAVRMARIPESAQ